MYAVVGCSDCSALWVVEGRSETLQCPRCGRTRDYDRRKKFLTTDDEDHAREVRASMLASRQGEGDAFAEVDAYGELEDRVEEAGVDDETYLEHAGVDADAVESAGERASEGRGTTGGETRPETVRAALREQDRPDRSAVLAYAAERGVPREAADDVLDRLLERGEAIEDSEGYRLL